MIAGKGQLIFGKGANVIHIHNVASVALIEAGSCQLLGKLMQRFGDGQGTAVGGVDQPLLRGRHWTG